MERLAGRKRLMKRQQPGSGSPLAEEEEEEEDLLQRSPGQPASGELHRVSGKTVSYTHLTLPTKRIV